jgi:hypothetical protein
MTKDNLPPAPGSRESTWREKEIVASEEKNSGGSERAIAFRLYTAQCSGSIIRLDHRHVGKKGSVVLIPLGAELARVLDQWTRRGRGGEES